MADARASESRYEAGHVWWNAYLLPALENRGPGFEGVGGSYNGWGTLTLVRAPIPYTVPLSDCCRHTRSHHSRRVRGGRGAAWVSGFAQACPSYSIRSVRRVPNGAWCSQPRYGSSACGAAFYGASAAQAIVSWTRVEALVDPATDWSASDGADLGGMPVEGSRGSVDRGAFSGNARGSRTMHRDHLRHGSGLQDSFDLTGQSTEGGVIEVSRLQHGAERVAATYYGETGRWSESFVFAKDTLICADERFARYDRPLSGIVVDSTPSAVFYADGVPSWFWALTANDSLAGKPDSLEPVGARLRQAADSIRKWIATERKARGTGAS